MQRSFKRVIKGEGKEVSEEALTYLSRAVDGSFRDGVKILDQVLSNSDKVELTDIEQVVSGSVGFKITGLVEALCRKDVGDSLAKLNEAIIGGVDLTYLLVSLMRGLRDKLVMGGVEVGVTKLIFSLDEVARRLATSLDGELLIQVAMVEWCGVAEDKKPENQNTKESKSVEGKSSWAAMKEKIRSGEKIGKSDTIDDAIAIFST